MSAAGEDFYDHPDLYDLEYQALVEDLGHYLRLCKGGAEVLELGCGTGRLTLPLARAGHRVVALDKARPMLQRLRQRLGDPRLAVEVVEGDFADFDLGRRFDRVLLPFNALHHLHQPEQVLGMLQCARRHLRPDGLFALDLIVPNADCWDRDPDGVHEVRWYPDPLGGRMKTWENGYYNPLTQVNLVRYHYLRADGRRQTIAVPLRMYYPQEIQGLIRLAGFFIERCDGDFAGKALEAGDIKMVMQLRVRGGVEVQPSEE